MTLKEIERMARKHKTYMAACFLKAVRVKREQQSAMEEQRTKETPSKV